MTAWVVTASPEAAALVELGGHHGPVAVVHVAAPEGVPVEALAPAVADRLAGEASGGDLVLVPNRPAERVLGAAIAVRWGVPLVTGAVGVRDGVVETRRHGGLLVEEVRIGAGLVVVAEGGAAIELPPALECAPAHAVTVAAEDTDVARPVDLAVAPRVVAVGRGASGVPDATVAALAEALGADVGRSRPVADASGDHHGYIGVSGAHVRPDLYVALGISGQLQHLAGVDAEVVVAVNSDPAAPIWAHADYGIVGDAAQVVPAWVEALR